MHSVCYSSTLEGVRARLVAVETVVTSGLPGLTVVGLPDAAVSEAGARVRSALKLAGFSLPPRRLVVNLSPADLRKSGSGFDLALALGLLEAMGELPAGCLSDALVVGELSLAGELRSVRGIVASLALAAAGDRIRRILVPALQASSIPRWEGVEVIPLVTLTEAVAYCRGKLQVDPPPPPVCEPTTEGHDLTSVYGQPLAKLALEISAAGGHHLALTGPPGCGKSLLASCLPSLLPPMTETEQQEVAAISSVCQDEIDFRRPFRAPGVSVSAVAMLGGYRPGEVTRAHRGVLFLDEFLEFRRDTLESLRLVLEEKRVKVSRARMQVEYPADFTLVVAMNPCPCGMGGAEGSGCICSPGRLASYQSKLSGPLLDRFDLLVGLKRVPVTDFARKSPSAESSAVVAKRVAQAREIQRARGCLNVSLSGGDLLTALAWSKEDHAFATTIADSAGLSLRGFEKWLRVARTVADLQGEAQVGRSHLLIGRSVRFATADRAA